MGWVCLTGSLVLQAPPAIFEGDSVVLRCRTKKTVAQNTLIFYKNDVALKTHGQGSELHIHHENLRNNDEYYCTKKSVFPSSSNKVKIQVQGTALIILNRLVRGKLSMVVEVE